VGARNDGDRANRKLTQLDSAGRQWLARTGFDSMYGARPLKVNIALHPTHHCQSALIHLLLALVVQRVIHGTILNLLSKEMLAGSIRDGAHVRVGTPETTQPSVCNIACVLVLLCRLRLQRTTRTSRCRSSRQAQRPLLLLTPTHSLVRTVLCDRFDE
jgi:hypothetical protein